VAWIEFLRSRKEFRHAPVALRLLFLGTLDEEGFPVGRNFDGAHLIVPYILAFKARIIQQVPAALKRLVCGYRHVTGPERKQTEEEKQGWNGTSFHAARRLAYVGTKNTPVWRGFTTCGSFAN
jgi:hypothetical protein